MCDTFFVLMEHDDLVPFHDNNDGIHEDDLADYTFLFDITTNWYRRDKTEIVIENRSRTCSIKAKKKEDALEILLCLHAIRYNYCRYHNITIDAMGPDKEYPNDSFAPVRQPTPCRWYVCGKDYMEAAAEGMEQAKEKIFICDWQISPCVYLKRPWNAELQCHVPDDYWRLA